MGFSWQHQYDVFHNNLVISTTKPTDTVIPYMLCSTTSDSIYNMREARYVSKMLKERLAMLLAPSKLQFTGHGLRRSSLRTHVLSWDRSCFFCSLCKRLVAKGHIRGNTRYGMQAFVLSATQWPICIVFMYYRSISTMYHRSIAHN